VIALLRAEGLELAYGEVAACRGLSFHVAEGEIVTLIGANGAGKSTTLRAIAGALLPRLGISLVPEGRRVFPFLTVQENLELGAFKYRKQAAKVRALTEKVFDMFPRLSERKGQNGGTLSGGEQQVLALGRAIMADPYLVCLDEPSLGLAPMVVQDIFRTIKAINAAGTSVLLVEQNARYALETASRGYVLQTGSIIASGACATLRDDDRVRQAYLGRSAAAARVNL
jgi:branched-chain amino acid transport system ATP-binding protein